MRQNDGPRGDQSKPAEHCMVCKTKKRHQYAAEERGKDTNIKSDNSARTR